MANQRLELILHPVRLRIISILEQEPLTTQQITASLADVPASSVYRHLRTLLDAELIGVAKTRQVNGIEEKTYALSSHKVLLTPEDFQSLSKDELFNYFSIFFGGVLNSFSQYLQAAPNPDWSQDKLGFAEFTFYATPEEFLKIWRTAWEMLVEAEKNRPTAERVKRKMTIAMYPATQHGTTDASDTPT